MAHETIIMNIIRDINKITSILEKAETVLQMQDRINKDQNNKIADLQKQIDDLKLKCPYEEEEEAD